MPLIWNFSRPYEMNLEARLLGAVIRGSKPAASVQISKAQRTLANAHVSILHLEGGGSKSRTIP